MCLIDVCVPGVIPALPSSEWNQKKLLLLKLTQLERTSATKLKGEMNSWSFLSHSGKRWGRVTRYLVNLKRRGIASHSEHAAGSEDQHW